KAAIGGAWRRESFESLQTVVASGAAAASALTDTRSVTSAYGEVVVPFVGENNRLPLVRALSVDLAARVDHYTDFGSSPNPKMTVRWELSSDLAVHGSYSTSFRAPTLYLLDPNAISAGYIVDETNP